MGDVTTIFAGSGWVAGASRHLSCTGASGGYSLDIDGVGEFFVAADGASFASTNVNPAASSDVVTYTILGPPLILCLALQDAFCLHASAVSSAAGTVAFVGASGAGKSTLAARLSADQRLGWSRVADDTLAVEAAPNGVSALPHFPQLKLPAERQPWRELPERLRLDAVYVLDAPSPTDRVESCLLSQVDGLLAVLSRTVAASLFGPELRDRHLGFCAHVAATVPLRRLHYPWRDDALPAIHATIAHDLSAS